MPCRVGYGLTPKTIDLKYAADNLAQEKAEKGCTWKLVISYG
jgi:hypothetical protein